MKRLMASVVQAVALLALAGSTLGGGEGEQVPQRVCPDGTEQMHKKIAGLGLDCLGTSGSDSQLFSHSETLEDYKDFFKSCCGKQPQIRECLADVALTSRACQNDTRHRMFEVLREILETTLEAGCVQDGEVLANIVSSYNHETDDSDPLNDCASIFETRGQLLTKIGISDLSTMYIFYREIVHAKECINSKTELDQHLKSGIESILSVITENVKCFHPYDDSLLLCKNLDPKQDGSPRVCPIKSKDEKPLYDSLRYLFPVCISTLRVEGERIRGKSEILEHSRLYIKNECRKMPSINSCLKEVSSLSSSCLDERHRLILTIAQDLVTNILEQVCIEEGRHLANVAFNMARNTNISEEQAIKRARCFSIVSPEGQQAYEEDVTSEKSLEVYQVYKSFKGCLIDVLQGDDVAVASAELMLNGVIDNMKCLDRELTTSVLCSTIANTV